MPILHKAMCDNYCIVKCFLKSNVAIVVLTHELQVLTLPDYICICIFQFEYFLLSSFILYSMVFCRRGFFSNALFRTFDYFWKHLLNHWFHCVGIFYIKFRFCETLTVCWLKHCINKELLSVDLSYTYTCMF